MKQVTRNIDPDSARDLLEQVPRACIAFAHEEGPQALPVSVTWWDRHYLVAIPQGISPQPGSGQEVVLLVDEGIYFFDLRAIYIRGHMQPTQARPGAGTSHVWFEVVPTRVVAWDYGTLREVGDERV